MKLRYVTGTIAGLVLVVALAVGGYKLNWWLAEDTTNRTAQINQDSYQRQNALTEQILDDIKEAQDPALPANQRIAIVSQICDSAAKLTGTVTIGQNALTFIAKECS